MNQEQIKKHIVEEILPNNKYNLITAKRKLTYSDVDSVYNQALQDTHAKLDDIIEYVRGECKKELIGEYANITIPAVERRTKKNLIQEIEEYRKDLEKYHEEMVGTTHEDNRHMLMYDAHSRIIAIDHLLKRLSTNQK